MISNKYIVTKLLGKGKFGKVYSGKYIKTGETVAVKIENVDSNIKLLKNETAILNYLYHNGCRKIPFVYWYGIHENCPTLVMSCYEIALNDYIANNNVAIDNNVIDKKIISKIIGIIKSVHDAYIIHRDIKPQNFMFKNGDLYLVDFGLATTYVDGEKTTYRNPMEIIIFSEHLNTLAFIYTKVIRLLDVMILYHLDMYIYSCY